MILKFLSAASAWLSKWTPAVVAAAAVAAYFEPGLFGWVRGNAQTSVLGLIMLTMGMTLKSEDFRILASRPWDIAIGSLAQYTLMPLIAWTLVHVMGLPKAVGIGLMLVGCCPGGVSSNIMTFLCKGDVAFSVGMTALSTLVAPVVTPLLMLWLAGESVDVDAVGMFMSMLLVTIVPIAVGFSFNAAFGRSRGYGEVLKIMPGVAVAGLCCIVGGVVSAHGAVMAQTGAAIFAAVFLHNAIGYALGYAVGAVARFSGPKRRTVSIEVGMQNAGLATVLAGRHFPALPEVAIASAVSCVWHSISGALLAGIFNAVDSLVVKLLRRDSESAKVRKGYIFDMDGTIIDNVPYHIQAWKEFSRAHGRELRENDIVSWMGMTNRVYQERMLGRSVSDEESRRMSDEKENIYRKLYAPHMRLPDGLRALLDRAHAEGIACAVATGAPRGNVAFIMDGLSLRGDFAAIVDETMYAKCKPDPECFLTAARLIGCEPENCVVFEDAVSGIKAAKAAGMKAVGVAFAQPRDVLLSAGADLAVSSYLELAKHQL